MCNAAPRTLFASALLAAVALTGCDGDGNIVEPPVELNTCDGNSDCDPGYLCSGGSCIVGQCDPGIQDLCSQDGADENPDVGPYCCRSWQICNFTRQCEADPLAPIGAQCEVSDDCPNPGDFCSGGTCYQSSGRTPCTASFQCAAGERCDRTVFLCVPDNGGCAYCAEFPELCCEEDQNCDVETGFCVDPGEAVCTPATVEQDCPPNRQCDQYGRCVQCINDDDCGPGTACNEGTGSCYSILNSCDDDDDCNPPKRCSQASNECVVPECETDTQCQLDDPRSLCDLNSFTCYLPNAGCEEDDEPNNSTQNATALGALGGAGTVCRGDVDFLSFPIQGHKRYRATVSFLPAFTSQGVSVAILNGNGAQRDAVTLGGDTSEATVSAITDEGESGVYYLRVSGTGEDADMWVYNISITEEEAPQTIDCDDEVAMGYEPNDSFATAFDLATPSTNVFARCDQGDVDYYHFTLPPQNGVEVTVELENDDGDLAIALYDGPNASDEIDDSDAPGGDLERVEAGEGPTDLWLRVALWSAGAQGIDGQPYTVIVTPVPRPAECAADMGEPGDDTFAGAQPLATDTSTPGIRCVNVDVDHYTFTVPANYGGSVALEFTHSQGDLRLDVYDEAETLVASSNTSSSVNGTESVELPFAATEKTYVAKVRLHGSSGQVAQVYTLQASTYDATTCVASEPDPNNTLLAATCVGAGGLYTDGFPCPANVLPEPLAPPSEGTCASNPETPGCATTCGAEDEDWYRVGKLNDGQLLRAKLSYDPGVDGANGQLGLILARASADLSSITYMAYDSNSDLDTDVELSLNAPTVNPAFAREYVVIVSPEGAAGFSALPYRLELEVGDPCIADAEEPNQDPSQSTLVRTGGAPGVAYDETLAKTLCGFDTDVYELFAFVGEDVTATLAGPPGLQVEIGSRPTPITNPAVPLPGGVGMDVGGACPIDVPGDADQVVDGGVGEYTCAQASFVGNPQLQQVYITVKRENPDDLSSIGPYNLQVQVSP